MDKDVEGVGMSLIRSENPMKTGRSEKGKEEEI
jgi:hypothetical protein